MDFKSFFQDIFPQSRLNHSLRILISINASYLFIMGMFLPFYALFIQELGVGVAFAGFSWALLQIVTGVLIFAFGSLEIRVKEQELLLAISYFLRGIVFLSYAVMGSITQLFITQILWGVSAALGTPAFDSVYASHTSQSEAILQWGNWEGVAAIATGFAALVGGLVIESFGFTPVFIAMAAISVGLGIYIWLLPREVL
jgi:predicted MFS family arabinose efflux permease